MVTKAIEPGRTSVELYKIDLLDDANKLDAPQTVKDKVNENGEAECPWEVFFGHEWEGHSFDELVVLVPEMPVSNVEAEDEVNKSDGDESK